MPEIIKKEIHVRFSTEQRAALADQMADVQSQIEGVEKEKKKAMAGFNAKLVTLKARMHEFADAVRDGEGEIVVECMWKPDPAKPFEHLWRLDTYEQIETRPLAGKAAAKLTDAERQLDLTTPSPAPAGDGKAPPAGATPGETSPRPMATVTRLRIGPMPPCPAPVKDAPGGICGLDGDRDFGEGFCARHFAELAPEARKAILDGIFEVRRQMRVQEASEQRARRERDAIASEEDVTRAKLHTEADAATGEALDKIGAGLGCARVMEEGKGGEGETVRAPETDEDYRARVKVAIDAAHKAATARAAKKAAEAPPVTPAPTGDGAVPPIVREKPRAVTPDLIAQLAEASRAGAVAPAAAAGDDVPTIAQVLAEALPEKIPAGPEGVAMVTSAATQLAPGAIESIAVSVSVSADEPAPGNEAAPTPPPDEMIDGPQPIYNARNAEGWPLCPQCGGDELWSPGVPRSEATIVHCEACGWRPPVDAIPTRPALALPPPTPPIAFVPGKQVLHIGDVEIDTSGIADHGRLLRRSPCEHSEEIRPCVPCTTAAVAEERARLALPGAPPLPPPPVPEELRELGARVAAECPPLRRKVTATERSDRKAACECGKVVNIRPVEESGEWVATLPKHKRQVQG